MLIYLFFRASPDSQGCLIATFFDLVLHQNLNPETIRYVHELGEGVLIHSNFIKFKDGITSVIPEIVSKLEEVNMGSKEQITLKTICFQILTIVFTRLDKETINADINKAFCKSKNLDGLDSKAFLKKVVGVSDGTRSESLNIPSDCAEDYRKYHCAAYNCLIAIVTCTQTAEKFYVGYLYKEPKHIQATTFFEYLIVDDDIYFEDKNVGDLSKMKKYFVNLRLNSNHDESTSQNLRYLPSQTLVQSSLSEDFSRFDFSTSNLKERTHKLTKVIFFFYQTLHSLLDSNILKINFKKCIRKLSKENETKECSVHNPAAKTMSRSSVHTCCMVVPFTYLCR